MVNSTGFVQAPPPRQEDIPLPQTFEVPEVPTHTQTFGVPQVPTTGGGFLAPSGPGQPATSTVPSLSPSSGGGSGLGTGAAIGGSAALVALLNNMGRDSGSDSFSIQNMLGGLLKIGKLTGITGDGSILDKLLPEGFDLTSLPENLLNGITEALGLGGGGVGGIVSGYTMPAALQTGVGGLGSTMPLTGLMGEATAAEALISSLGTSAIGPSGMLSADAIALAAPAADTAIAVAARPAMGSLYAAAAPSTGGVGMAGGLEAASGLGGSIGLPAGGLGMGAGGFGGSAASAGHIAAIEGLTATSGTSMMAAFAPAAIAVAGIMALKASSKKDPGTLAAEAEQRFDQISATKSVAQKHGIQAAIDEFGYNQVLEYAPLFAPGAPGYTSPLLRDQRTDHAVLEEISANDSKGKEILEFVASNSGDTPLQGNTAELIKQLDISTAPSARMEEEMDFVLKQMSVPEEHRDYGISSNTNEFKEGLIKKLVDLEKLEVITDERGIKYYQKPDNEDPLMVGV